MLRKIYLLTAAVLIVTGYTAFAQSGAIKGKVMDKATKEPLPFANVIVEINGSQAGGAQTDFDGNFTIKPLTPGKYNLKASFVGYSGAEITGVLVSTDKITFQDLLMTKGAVDITAVEVTSYKNPIIDKGNPSTQTTVTQEEIKVAPTRDVKSVAATTAGVFQKDEGDDLNVRGSRSDATDYYIDGIKVRGSTAIPQSGIEQITVVTGGVPAQYGDATGGIINITTRGPSKEFFGGVEFVTSELFDKYGYNLIGANLSGPIWSKKNAEGKVDRTIVGFFLSGEYQIEKDPDPSAIGMYKVKDDVYNDITSSPLYPSLQQGGSVYRNKTEYLTANDFEKIKAKQNVASKGYRVSGKIDVQPLDNVTLTFGGSYDHNSKNEFILNNSLFTPANNNQKIDDSWRVFGRITQKLGGNKGNAEASASSIKNAYYSIQVDYNKEKIILQDENHEDRFFDYGYVGKFDVIKKQGLTYDNPTITQDPITGQIDTAFTLFGPGGQGIFNIQNNPPSDSIVFFNPGGINTITEAYTSQYYNLVGNNYIGNYQNLAQVATNGGLVNGSLPRNTYSLYRSPGYTYNLYRNTQSTQFRVSAQVSADVKSHAIIAGFEYEQRSDQQYGINPVGLWGLMRLRANEKNRQLDTDNPIYDGNTVYYNRRYDSDGFNTFFENVRSKLASAGYSNVSNSDFLNIDAIDPSLLTLDLFTADELLNSGNNLVGYYGFDYKGEKQSGAVSFDDFWTATDANGNKTRPMGSFEPIYMAGYIQDKFAINDLIFNVGVRVDRYDANQKVLKDKYLLYPARTAGEVAPDRPSNIGDNFIVYVNDVRDPENAAIVGYRDEDTWYDATGNVVSNPQQLALLSGGEVSPWLADPEFVINQGGIQSDAFKPSDSFKDYAPAITVMPRVAFSFPISDEALFFAHYDVLTQRPPSRSRTNALDYYYIETQGSLLNNPNLKPERTTDYELGFKQTLSKSSAISISGFYRELRDMIQQTKVNFAYPVSYLTFDNIDFGTVKGLSFGYDLRRTGNIRLSANYTLQFADGTGSGDRTSDKLLQNGQPNLRTIAPLDFDQRHAITVSVDYRYDAGKDYNGPMIKNTQILANTGLNLVLRAGSGLPYSRQRDVTTQANNIGLQQISSGLLDGEINGSRLPWQYRIDLKVDRDFKIKFGKSENGKMAYLNVYIQVQNLFDTQNIINVYRYTGNPNDDGYLASATGQQLLNSGSLSDPTAFTDQYSIKVNDPSNYSLPRRARLGIKLDF